MAKRTSLPVIVLLVLVLSLSGSIFLSSPVAAVPDEIKWSKVNIPGEGKAGNWVLASGASVEHPTMAIDGTLYCYADPAGTDYRLYKSIDGGEGWCYSGGVTERIVDIATAPDDADTVYYATSSNVYQSTDAGNSFAQLPANPGGAGSNKVEITSIDAACMEGRRVIAVGTRDMDGGEYGGVYVPNEPFTDWVDTNAGNYDVLRVALAQNFSVNREVTAVVSDETDTLVIAKVADNNWGDNIGGAIIWGGVAESAEIGFADDYSSNTAGGALFVAIDSDSNNGDVYRVNREPAPGNSVATDLNIGDAYGVGGVDVTSLAIAGNTTTANLLAGAADSAEVYASNDGGASWTRSSKAPTGEERTYVLMTSEGRAYAATSGSESAFSQTTDGGATWNQLSLIDSGISAIVDLAVSQNYRRDNTLFMITFGSGHSLWRSLDGGTTWERVLNSSLPDIDEIKLVEVSTQYGNGSDVVFLAGVSNGNAAVWKSTDKGQTFTVQIAPRPIGVWAVASDNTIFTGCYDGSNGLVYRSDDGGASYTTGATAGSEPLNSLVLSPDYENDGTVLTGNTCGRVYWSDDNGASFTALGQQLSLVAGVGEVTISFDPGYSSNKTVYAASNAKVTVGSRERIHRFIIGSSDTWKSIGGTLPDDAVIQQLRVSADGTLYAINSQEVNATGNKGGMERSLNPAFPLNPTFETVTRGLDDEVTMDGLWLSDNRLWSIDTLNNRLMTYTDDLSQPIILASPPNHEGGIATRNGSLEWAGVPGATEYKWQLDHEPDFSSVPEGFEGNSAGSSVHLPVLELATKYYWRVRATKPVLSPWSTRCSFTTVLGGAIIAPELLCPEAGINKVALKPVFQWSAIAGADSYELMVSKDSIFTSPVIQKVGRNALPTTAWQSDIELDHDTTYYWRIRAKSTNSFSAWSTVGAFTTDLPALNNPAMASEQTAPVVPNIEIPPIVIPEIVIPPFEIPPIIIPPLEIPAPQFTVPDWAIYSVIVLLTTMVLLLVAVLVLVVMAMKRS